MVRDVSVSCAELKLVTVRVARPKHRKTAEKARLGLRARDQGEVRHQVRHQVRNGTGRRATRVAQLGQGSLGPGGLWVGVCWGLGEASHAWPCPCLSLSPPLP